MFLISKLLIVVMIVLLSAVTSCDNAALSKNDRIKIQLEKYYKEKKLDDVFRILDNLKDPNGAYLMNGSVLRDAVCNGDEVVLKRLLLKGANPNWHDVDGEPVLISAVRNQRYDSVVILLAAGADVNAEDVEGKNAVYWSRTLWKRDLAK